jgi:hypothetical protein
MYNMSKQKIQLLNIKHIEELLGLEEDETRVDAAYKDDEDQFRRILVDDMKWKQLRMIHDLTLHPIISQVLGVQALRLRYHCVFGLLTS